MPELKGKIRVSRTRKKAMLNKGKCQYRFADNPEEKAFAEAWEDVNRGPTESGVRTLDSLLAPDGVHVQVPTKEERTLAATVVQWLGSPCGQFFLNGVGWYKQSDAKQKT